jgi:hypothetical protein
VRSRRPELSFTSLNHCIDLAWRPFYDCAKSRRDHVQTRACRSVGAPTVDQVVANRLLQVLGPDEIALALAAADEVTERRQRSTRASELALERAQYDADRAERALLACEPENRLVARSLESHWEAKLAAVAEAGAALAVVKAAVPTLPPRAELEALATDLACVVGSFFNVSQGSQAIDAHARGRRDLDVASGGRRSVGWYPVAFGGQRADRDAAASAAVRSSTHAEQGHRIHHSTWPHAEQSRTGC